MVQIGHWWVATVFLLAGLWVPARSVADTPSTALPGIEIRRFLSDQPIWRAGRSALLKAEVINLGDEDAEVSVTLSLPKGVRVVKTNAENTMRLGSGDDEKLLIWELESESPLAGKIGLVLSSGGKALAQESLKISFLPAVKSRQLSYIPEPVAVPTEMLIGAHHCPLWESDQPQFWSNVLKHPERTPALGFYSQENPEIADWETKWAVEHGISFFIYCWYRTSQGGPVETKFESAIHDALFHSKYVDKMKYTIMWENQSRDSSGVSDETDLMENLLPFWMENYFKHPSYLKVDNRPVLFIYRPEFLVQDLGTVENVQKVFAKMRQSCREAGFDGLYLMGEYRGTDPKHLDLMKSLGLDYTFAYCWYVPDNPTPEQAIDTQMSFIRKTQELSILPQVVTVSQAWSGWDDGGSIWKIPPQEFEQLLRLAKEFTATLPERELGSRMLLLDNWNEWGEGHYIAPHREHGFGYLDAVRKVFSTAPVEHEDLIPEDIGMGPYDTVNRRRFEDEAELRREMTRKLIRPDAAVDLVGWWTFDEKPGSPAAHDVSGHRLGGAVGESIRVVGFEGNALLCDGTGVVIPFPPTLSEMETLTIECRVKTDLAGQDEKWLANRITGDNPSAGFRLGMQAGKPSFQLPLSNWSHQLTGSEPLPVGRWVHLAATFDGEVMRLYLDGIECGTMKRPGTLQPCKAHLVLGNFDVGHAAHFTGHLDDVRLYRRALAADEIRSHSAFSAR